jgi:SAM-dependent methyltransferase
VKGDSDELYEISESEPEEFPIKLSRSVKKRMVRRDSKQRYPSIAIPSPGQWPTIDKIKSTTSLSSPFQMALSPSVLARLQEQTYNIPPTSATPSLDGSLTSEELAGSSCPSTPDLPETTTEEQTWEAPVRLDPSAMNLLQHLDTEEPAEQVETTIEIPAEATQEMREIVESPSLFGLFRIDTQRTAPPEADDPLSALSVPSPSGFFASLNSSMARSTWTSEERAPDTCTATDFYGLPFRRDSEPPVPLTSTAASFYNLPWQQRPENPVEHVITMPVQDPQDPITARKILFSPTETIVEVDEIDETYDEKLKASADEHVDRTKLWLTSQDAYMQAICEEDEKLEDFEGVQDAVPAAPEASSPDVTSPMSLQSKKSVRFAADAVPHSLSGTPEAKKRVSPIHDGTFWQGWRYHKRSERARDVFQHRQARVEAEQVRRVSLHKQHVEQLQGKYEITTTERPAPSRPISDLVPAVPQDEKSQIIAQADRERQALEQMQSSSWHLAAQREVNGGKLLTSPVVQSFKGRKDVNILDLAGQAHCGWAWSVAIEHPQATVYTTVSTDAEAHVAEICLDGPPNHVVAASPKLYELPFESNFFDVVSARNLYAHLKTTWPQGHAVDEWDLTLRECMRVLKPGGYLEYDLLDAELALPDAAGQALGVEFAFNLKTRGYDPSAGKSFMPRLKRAGFRDIKRAWMLFPVADVAAKWNDAGKARGEGGELRTIAADGTVTIFEAPTTGSTKDVRAVTGLVGARLWEQWMMKLCVETGRSEKQCLQEVAHALEEGGRGSAAWRCLVGWARKDI